MIDYNKLGEYSIHELLIEKGKLRRVLLIGILGCVILLSILAYKAYAANRLDWTLLLPLTLVVLIFSTKSYQKMIDKELLKRR